MSAIFGLFSFGARPVEASELDLMGAALEGFGPDGGGVWTSDNVGLGQRLMCFTPEDLFESQPVHNSSGQCVLVADARIDNRPELAHELRISPPEIASLADSAFILHAYEKWGVDCPRHLAGAFTFALYDNRNRSLLIARSPMGERTLFFYESSRVFAFASAPRGLFVLSSIPREVNMQSIADFLALAPKEPGSSFFAGISMLQPGHSLVVRSTGSQSKRFRGLETGGEVRFSRDEDYVEAFTELFDRVVADYTRSRTSVGVMMSGGLDSPAIASSAALALRHTGKKLHSFTEIPRPDFSGPVPKGRYADETLFVETMRKKYDILDVHLVRSTGRCYLDDLDKFYCAMERPMRSTSSYPWFTSILREASQQNARVVLTGALGNFTISWDGQGLLPKLLRELKWARAAREARALASGRNVSPARVLIRQGLGPMLPDSVWLGLQRFRIDVPRYYAGSFRADLSPIRAEFIRHHRVAERSREKAHDFRVRSGPRARAGFLIEVADPQSDARRAYESLFGVHLRNPAGDMRLAEFCLSIPEEQWLRNGEPRWLIRRAMSERLPAEILSNRLRGLQAADWIESLRDARSRIAEEFQGLEQSPLVNQALDVDRMRHLVEQITGSEGKTRRTATVYRGALERALAGGHFLAWLEAGAPA